MNYLGYCSFSPPLFHPYDLILGPRNERPGGAPPQMEKNRKPRAEKEKDTPIAQCPMTCVNILVSRAINFVMCYPPSVLGNVCVGQCDRDSPEQLLLSDTLIMEIYPAQNVKGTFYEKANLRIAFNCSIERTIWPFYPGLDWTGQFHTMLDPSNTGARWFSHS